MNAGVTSNPKNVNNLLNEPIAKFFKGRNFAFVATINKDGSPQVTPTWIDIEKVTRGADEHIDKLAKRYLNIERYPGHSRSIKRVILKIKPEKIFYLPPRYSEY